MDGLRGFVLGVSVSGAEQLSLLDALAPAVALPVRQAAVLELVESRPEGVRADEAGAVVHAQRGKHPAASRCTYCAQDGRGVLAALVRKGLVHRRRPGDGGFLFVPVNVPCAQLRDGDPWPEGF